MIGAKCNARRVKQTVMCKMVPFKFNLAVADLNLKSR